MQVRRALGRVSPIFLKHFPADGRHRHTPFGGAANIDDGITFDLQKLNEVTVSSNKKTVRIGPGNRWGDVYLKLDALNLATSGGRVSIVGAGGLITGGGVSFFSPRYGYVCDNVENFEVVLASGQIVNANARSNPDLWRALRGGSNNFGIVTAFDMRTFPQGNFWGGFGGISISTLQQQFRAFEKLTGAKPYDPYAALIFSLVWDISTNTWSASHNFVYTKPEANPPVFQDFTSLPQVFNTTRISNLTDFAIEIARSSPSGRRQLFGTGTYKNSAAMMNTIYEIGNEVVQRLRSVPAIKWSLSFQPLPTVIQAVAATNGGNSLGLDESDGDLFNVLLTATWDTEAADGLVEAQAKQLFDRANAQASAIGVLNEYIYLNYAAPWQDPITGYGAAAKASLQAASRRYDPKGLFQRNVPGGFKLFD